MQVEAVNAFAIEIRNGVGIQTVSMIGLSVDIPVEGRLVVIASIFRLNRRNVIITDCQLNDDDTVAAVYVLQMEQMVAGIERNLVGVFFVVERQLTRTHSHRMIRVTIVGVHCEVKPDDTVATMVMRVVCILHLATIVV